MLPITRGYPRLLSGTRSSWAICLRTLSVQVVLIVCGLDIDQLMMPRAWEPPGSPEYLD
jgi:hypothetical protein